MSREIDALVAEKVMGLVVSWDMKVGDSVRYHQPDDHGLLVMVPRYSSEAAACAEMEDKFLRDGWVITVRHNIDHYEVDYYLAPTPSEDEMSFTGYGATRWEASAHAALEAVKEVTP